MKCIFVWVTFGPLSSSQIRNIDQRRTEAALQKGPRAVWFASAIMIALCEQSWLESGRPLWRHGDEPRSEVVFFFPPVLMHRGASSSSCDLNHSITDSLQMAIYFLFFFFLTLQPPTQSHLSARFRWYLEQRNDSFVWVNMHVPDHCWWQW